MRYALLSTPLYQHLKNPHRIKFVADIYRMMYRWGMVSELDTDIEINRLQLKMFVNDLANDVVQVQDHK